MAITWTIIVLGALLHDASTQKTSSTSLETTKPTSVVPTSPTSSNPTTSKSITTISTITTTVNKGPTTIVNKGPPTTAPTTLSSTTPTTAPTTPNSTKPAMTPGVTPAVTPAMTPAVTPAMTPAVTPAVTPTTLKSTTPTMTPTTMKSITHNPTTPTKQNTIITTSKDPIPSSASLTPKVPTGQPSTSDSAQVTTKITTMQPTTTKSNTSPTDSNPSIKSSTSSRQDTTSSNKPATTTHKRNGTYPDNRTDRTSGTTNSTSGIPKQETQTTSALITSTLLPGTTPPVNVDTWNFTHDGYDLSLSSKGGVVLETCKKLAQNLKGNCSVTIKIEGKKLIATVTIDADQSIPPENYKSLQQKDEVTQDTPDKEGIPDTLIAILASSGALVLILCCFAAYCTYHRRSYRKNQQHLTEELQTVENGYHDNPTLEVMEVQPEMQEKKLTLNGEFNDSWIVPIDNLLKEDIPDEEDTHL